MSAYVKRLADYDIERLTEAVDAMFTASAFYGRIKSHMTVILKPNLVMRSAPEEAIITHPNVTAAVAICLLRQGGRAGGGKRRRAVQYIYHERHVPRVQLYGSGGKIRLFVIYSV